MDGDAAVACAGLCWQVCAGLCHGNILAVMGSRQTVGEGGIVFLRTEFSGTIFRCCCYEGFPRRQH